MKKYKLINSVTGWVIFAIAAVTYILTAEPTASLWDCGEFIATANKLEVGHPPGAPLFMMISRVFGLLGGDDMSFARYVNYMSALASAFTILLLFWSITHLAKKLVVKSEENYSLYNIIAIIGSGIVGALAYTFSDTFWFSAVEGEVYALSSLFTALVFWAILKWEEHANEKYANRWLILIMYLMGLSIGVHLLNLLTIPALAMVYYYKKYNASIKGAIMTLIISFVVLGLIMYGFIQGLVKMASFFEIGFVNSFELPYNSGFYFFIILVAALLVFGIYYTHKKQKVLLNTIFLSATVLLIGYSSYAAIVIRAYAEPPINENKPSNAIALLSYLNREQYGDRPLLHGNYYNAPVIEVNESSPIYSQYNGKYEITGHNYEPKYDNRFETFFPRMHSSDPGHINVYKEWGNVSNRNQVQVTDDNGKIKTESVPTFINNLAFFFKYQVGYMYMRYFMWNFVGRQNDTQGYGGILKGQWISGIDAIDRLNVGSQKHLPEHMKNVPSRNVYYFLPFLLGIIGLMFQFDRSRKDFSVVALLFFMTGLAIVLYLNQTPNQPRERDYAYAGSFYAFAIWIGLGVLALIKWIKSEKFMTARAIATVALCIGLVPYIMAKENWDDHDRSGRYTARAYAYNYLNSCEPNAILFTFGDNDTFPLWYAQEVEGIRRDVRVVNTMLLNMDWYIEGMKMKAYESDPLPLTMDYSTFMGSKKNRVYIIEKVKEAINAKDAVDFLASNHPDTKLQANDGSIIDYLPGKTFFIPVDTVEIYKNKIVDKKDAALVEKNVVFTISGSAIDKSQMATLDIIANNNWKRPIYFVSNSTEGTLGLDKYLQLDGFAFKLVPIKTNFSSYLACGRIDSKSMYDKLMNKFDYGRMEQPDVYMDHFNIRTLAVTRFRNNFTRLAQQLLTEGRKDSAIKVLDRCMGLAPVNKIPEDIYLVPIAETYLAAGATDKGKQVIEHYFNTCTSELKYFYSLSPSFRNSIDYDIRYNIQVLSELGQIAEKYKLGDLSKSISEKFTMYYQMYNPGDSPQ